MDVEKTCRATKRQYQHQRVPPDAPVPPPRSSPAIVGITKGGGTTSIKVGGSALALSAGGAGVTFQRGGPHASTGGVGVPVTALLPISLNSR
jgi:hypothetical protein